MSSQPRVKFRLHQLRTQRNRMTQTELAKKSGLSKTTISNLESGHLKRIELDTIAKLCLALSCTPNELFELLEASDTELIARQKEALLGSLGLLEYDKPVVPDELNRDLAEIIDAKLRRASGE